MDEPVKPATDSNAPEKTTWVNQVLKAVSKLRTLYDRLGRLDRLAVIASLVLFISQVFPWYKGKLYVVEPDGRVQSIVAQHSGIGTFSFIEIALLITAASVLFLLFARAEGHAIRLPISDGTLFASAGVWAIFLIVFRSFDRPEISFEGASAEMGLQWGIFVALISAIVLALVGLSKQRSTPDAGP